MSDTETLAVTEWGAASPGGGRRRLWLRPVLLLSVIVALAAAAPALALGDRLAELRGWIEGLGALGPFAFALIYAVAAARGASLPTAAALQSSAPVGPEVQP